MAGDKIVVHDDSLRRALARTHHKPLSGQYANLKSSDLMNSRCFRRTTASQLSMADDKALSFFYATISVTRR